MDNVEISRLMGKPLNSQKIAIEEKVAECVQIVQDKIGNVELQIPKVSYDLRGTTAGQALGGHRIRMNIDLMHTNWDEMLNQTLPHEVAHCLVSQIWRSRNIPVRSHGQQWAYIMSILGLPATRCHTMEVEPTRKHPRKYLYSCACRIHRLTSHRHNKIMNGKTYYTCNVCGSELHFNGVDNNA